MIKTKKILLSLLGIIAGIFINQIIIYAATPASSVSSTCGTDSSSCSQTIACTEDEYFAYHKHIFEDTSGKSDTTYNYYTYLNRYALKFDKNFINQVDTERLKITTIDVDINGKKETKLEFIDPSKLTASKSGLTKLIEYTQTDVYHRGGLTIYANFTPSGPYTSSDGLTNIGTPFIEWVYGTKTPNNQPVVYGYNSNNSSTWDDTCFGSDSNTVKTSCRQWAELIYMHPESGYTDSVLLKTNFQVQYKQYYQYVNDPNTWPEPKPLNNKWFIDTNNTAASTFEPCQCTSLKLLESNHEVSSVYISDSSTTYTYYVETDGEGYPWSDIVKNTTTNGTIIPASFAIGDSEPTLTQLTFTPNYDGRYIGKDKEQKIISDAVNDTGVCLDTIKIQYCGDGTINGTEQCDDANTTNGDGCENNCTITPIPVCQDINVSVVDNDISNGSTVKYTINSITPANWASNVVIEVFNDKGSLATGTTITAYDKNSKSLCPRTATNTCTFAYNSSVVLPINVTITGVKTNYKINIRDNDSTTADSGVEDPTDNKTDCFYTDIINGCGDGIRQPPEECDDGNTVDDDACSNSCELPILPICGDGIINQPSEECDDGNNINGDGCDNTCTKTPEVEVVCKDFDFESYKDLTADPAYIVYNITNIDPETWSGGLTVEVSQAVDSIIIQTFKQPDQNCSNVSKCTMENVKYDPDYGIFVYITGIHPLDTINIYTSDYDADVNTCAITETIPPEIQECKNFDLTMPNNFYLTNLNDIVPINYFIQSSSENWQGIAKFEDKFENNDFNGLFTPSDTIQVQGLTTDEIVNYTINQEALNHAPLYIKGYIIDEETKCFDDLTFHYCGDGTIQENLIPGMPTEQCDDGNNINGDGCSTTCETEILACTNLDIVLPNGSYIFDTTKTMPITYYLNGSNNFWKDSITFTDNGANGTFTPSNIFQTEGLESTGTVNYTINLTGANHKPVKISADNTSSTDLCYDEKTFSYCGDSEMYESPNYSEQCDDGNNIDGDGCSATCETEIIACMNLDISMPNGSYLKNLNNPVKINYFLEVSNIHWKGLIKFNDNNSNGSFSPSDSLDPTVTEVQFASGPKYISESSIDYTLNKDGLNHKPLKISAYVDGEDQVCFDELTFNYCGDGVINDDISTTQIEEQCDDGNNIDGDTCNSICQMEALICQNFETQIINNDISDPEQSVEYQINQINPEGWSGNIMVSVTDDAGLLVPYDKIEIKNSINQTTCTGNIPPNPMDPMGGYTATTCSLQTTTSNLPITVKVTGVQSGYQINIKSDDNGCSYQDIVPALICKEIDIIATDRDISQDNIVKYSINSIDPDNWTGKLWVEIFSDPKNLVDVNNIKFKDDQENIITQCELGPSCSMQITDLTEYPIIVEIEGVKADYTIQIHSSDTDPLYIKYGSSATPNVTKGTCLFEDTLANPLILGDFVWIDNGDYIQSSSEPGINNINVALYQGDANGVCDYSKSPIATTTTANHPTNGQPGYYYFDVSPNTKYCVKFDEIQGYGFCKANQGTDTTIDSNPNPLTGIATVSMVETDDLTIDACYNKIICSSLTIDNQITLTANDATTEVNINATLKVSSSKWTGKVKFSSTGTGYFQNPYESITQTTNLIQGNPIEVSINGDQETALYSFIVSYHNPKAGDIITISVVDENYCSANITVTQESSGGNGGNPTPGCGDGKLQPLEECDYAATEGQEGYNPNCDGSCHVKTSTGGSTPPSGPICGDGNMDTGEECDDGSLNGTSQSTCQSTCTKKVSTGGGHEEPEYGNPLLEKTAIMNTNRTQVAYLPKQDDHANYQITYWNNNSQYNEITITDDIGKSCTYENCTYSNSDGKVLGYSNNKTTGDYIYPWIKYNSSTEHYFHGEYIEGDFERNKIEDCQTDNPDTAEIDESTQTLCHVAGTTIYSPNGTQFLNVEPEDIVIVIYQGAFELGAYSCDDKNCGAEEFINYAYSVSTSPKGDTKELQDDAVLYGLCKYLITRNSGDVMLYTPIEGGADLSCLTNDESRNTTGLAISPEVNKEEIISAGMDAENKTSSLCDSDANNSSIISNFSSFLCEIKTTILDSWIPEKISEQITENIDLTAKNNNNLNTLDESNKDLTIETLDDLLMLNNNADSNGKIFRKTDGGNLILSPTTQSFFQDGAYTFIVEGGGNLIINKNLGYAQNSSSEYGKIPSVAFIVIGGNVLISPNVTDIVGVYYVSSNDEGIGGKIQSNHGNDSTKQLRIYGSVFGDIQDLLNTRLYIGNPMADGANVKIIYDNRVMLNTPPGLTDFVDQTQFIDVAR
ncbi:hypothetical protein A2263_00890 [Candidatus Peregrinibacteria bacterium RIFOXYA2_FULL_33_21]|nr:MAG: hypothetical protein A2263_00890 [Candidatus Peregrinibacteria bacterium RIFOXYA2_FULL_33_21]